ncbi:MAG: protein kinase family protein, partial [Pseudanabaena sp.]
WKIADFGLSKALDRGTMQASKIAGTPYYMPPELFRNGYVSTKWDVWSLGVMIVEMLTGHFPFEAGGNVNTEVVIKELERKIQRENPNLQGVSSEWIDVVKGCLVKDHAQRWVAADVLKALDSIGVSTPQNKPPTIPQPKPSSQKTTPVHASPSSSNGFWSKTLAIAALLCGVGFMIWQLVKPVNAPFVTSPSSSPSPKETVSSKTAEQFFNDGEIKANSKDYKGAIADFNEAIRLKSDYADAYYNRGLVKSILGDQQGAIADYNEVIRLKPDFADAYYRRGGAKDELGDKQGAIADYNEAIRLKPDYDLAYIGRGLAKMELGDRQGAITDYNEVIRFKPDSALAYFLRGVAKYSLGDKQGSIADYNEAIRLKPDFANPYYSRGVIKKERGEKQEALADFRKASELYQKQGDTEFYNKSLFEIRELGRQ